MAVRPIEYLQSLVRELSKLSDETEFGLEDKESYKSSRVIKDTVKAGLLKPVDEDTAPRYMKYVP